MIDEAGARQRVEAELARWRQTPGYPDVVIDTVTEHRRAWVVTYGTPDFLAGRDMRDRLVGATPFVVDRRTGTVRTYGSGQNNLFRGWLDDATPEERRALFEDDATVLVGRRVTGVQYWDIHDFGQGKGPWDHGSWHHAVMGLGLTPTRARSPSREPAASIRTASKSSSNLSSDICL